ncbi:MAG: hypothetical protein WCJ40_20380 [Planctomycetota bacterium]
MGLLDKTNPNATRRSVLRQSLISAITTPLVVFVISKPAFRRHWRVTVPIFTLMGAGIGALVEWQVDDAWQPPHQDEDQLEQA